MPQQQSQANVRQRANLKEPHQWAVVLWNDDFTTMDFVVKVLYEVFYKSRQDAEQLMLRVHKEGKATVGVYSYDIAVSRADRATAMARDAGFPLKITCKEV